MTKFRIEKSDIIMILTGIFIGLFHVYVLPAFTFWHFMLISSAYGGYITLRLFTSFQRGLAEKKGMLREYEEINRLEKETRGLSN